MNKTTKEKHFPWNGNALVKQVYTLDNYRIIHTGTKNKNAIVFFAGNGIYYPSEEKYFKEALIDNNRFEWENIAQDYNLRKTYSLIILVRDIFKTWYLEGINERINTQEKVIEKIKELTKGYDVTTCGNSAGGYMAVLTGIKIRAKRVFTFSGQFFLIAEGRLAELINTEKNKYYSLVPLLKDFKETKIYYFCPRKCDEDIDQYNQVKDYNIYIYGFNENRHGYSFEYRCYKTILSQSDETLMKLYSRYKDTLIEPKAFTKDLHRCCSIRHQFLRFLQFIFCIENYHSIRIIKILGMKIKVKKAKNNG